MPWHQHWDDTWEFVELTVPWYPDRWNVSGTPSPCPRPEVVDEPSSSLWVELIAGTVDTYILIWNLFLETRLAITFINVMMEIWKRLRWFAITFMSMACFCIVLLKKFCLVLRGIAGGIAECVCDQLLAYAVWRAIVEAVRI